MRPQLKRAARLAIGVAVVLGLATLSACDLRAPKVPAARVAFSLFCAYPTDLLDLNRFGGPCPLPAEQLNKGGLPCEIELFAHNDPEARKTWLYEYDAGGRVVAAMTRHLGRPTLSWKYSYEQTGDSVIAKQAEWHCGSDPVYKPLATYHIDGRGYLVSVEGAERTVNLRYKESWLGGTGVFISGGERAYSFQLNRNGEVEERNTENSTEYPTSLEYDHEDGHISKIEERARDKHKLYEMALDYEHDRLKGVDIKTFSNGRYMLEQMKMTYECKVFPTCEGVVPVAGPAKVMGRLGLPTSGMPDLSGVKARDPKPAQWASALRSQINTLRRSSGKPVLKWDDALNDVAQRDVERRSEGDPASDMSLVRMLGYAVPVRVERSGAATTSAEPSPEDLEVLSQDDVWDSVARRRLGMGLARLPEGDTGAGRFAIVLVSADKAADKIR